MKNIIPALNKIQLVCQDRNAPLADLGKARKELFEAIRDTLIRMMSSSPENQSKLLADFDKLNQ
jgi:hypothetical protein